MNFKRTGAAIIAALSITAFAAACGDDDDEPNDDGTVDVTETTTAGS